MPAKTPPDIIRKLLRRHSRVLAEPAIKARLEHLGVAAGSTPAELAAYLKAEMDKWGPVIKEAGITGPRLSRTLPDRVGSKEKDRHDQPSPIDASVCGVGARAPALLGRAAPRRRKRRIGPTVTSA